MDQCLPEGYSISRPFCSSQWNQAKIQVSQQLNNVIHFQPKISYVSITSKEDLLELKKPSVSTMGLPGSLAS